jgi:glycosyltransferase involved in cell wall biosynthesis
MFGGRLHCIHYFRFQSPLYAPAKYVLQAIRTWQVLFTERPQLVHVQNPPFVCGLVVFCYCCVTSTRFILDHHSAAFGRVWDWALPIQRFLARQAITNLVTNLHWAGIVRSWRAHTFILPDALVTPALVRKFAVAAGFNVAYINTFSPDEPLEAVLEAATYLPNVHFYITGNIGKKSASFFAATPANVTFTGFLPDPDYFGLLNAVQAVMALTTRDYTLQSGGIEAVSLSKPLITSDWPYLQGLFPQGAIYVPNTAEGIRDGLLSMQQEHEQLRAEMTRFRETTRQESSIRLAQLRELVAQAS